MPRICGLCRNFRNFAVTTRLYHARTPGQPWLQAPRHTRTHLRHRQAAAPRPRPRGGRARRRHAREGRLHGGQRPARARQLLRTRPPENLPRHSPTGTDAAAHRHDHRHRGASPRGHATGGRRPGIHRRAHHARDVGRQCRVPRPHRGTEVPGTPPYHLRLDHRGERPSTRPTTSTTCSRRPRGPCSRSRRHS